MKIISANANIPRAVLLEYHQEFQSYKGKGIGMLLRNKIQEFYDLNGARINAILDLRQNTVKEFYEHDQEGKPIQRQVEINGEPQVDAQGNPQMDGVLKEGKTLEEFIQRLNEQATEMIPYTMV